MRLRRELHRRGLRCRVDPSVPGLARVRPDLLFIRRRVAVFVEGCFWHACPDPAHLPKSDTRWWVEKLQRNVVRVWEHEDPAAAADRVVDVVRRAAVSDSGRAPRRSRRC